MTRSSASRRRSAEVVRARKMARVEAAWGPDRIADRSWMRWVKCVLCGTKFCVNNNLARRIEWEAKVFGRWVCPWCMGRGGKQNLQRMILVERLVKLQTCLGGNWGDEEGQRTCKCVACVARRLFGADVADR